MGKGDICHHFRMQSVIEQISKRLTCLFKAAYGKAIYNKIYDMILFRPLKSSARQNAI